MPLPVIDGGRGFVSPDEAPPDYVDFETLDATPVDVVICDVPNVGDSFAIPSIFVVGKDPAGVFGSSFDFQGAVLRTSVPATNITNSFALTRTWGVGVGGIAVVAVGTQVVVRCTGVAATVQWRVRWLAFPVVP